MSNTNTKQTEMRYDPLFGRWVLIAGHRTKRPMNFCVAREECTTDLSTFFNPFAKITNEEAHEETVLDVIRNSEGEAMVYVVPNKYPLLQAPGRTGVRTEGPYQVTQAKGAHELFVYRETDLNVWDFSVKRTEYMFEAFQKRAMNNMRYKSVVSNFLFHNHGREGGASLKHPHSQLLSLPEVPPELDLVLSNSEQYHKEQKRHLFEVIQDFEEEQSERVIYRNDDFLVFVPYAPYRSYEIMIMPREQAPHFEYMTEDKRVSLSVAFVKAMHALKKVLQKPDYNFFLYSAPVDGRKYKAMRWFMRIVPHHEKQGGIELGGGLRVCSTSPEVSAAEYRKSIR
jgi:UDPglucose--hexose-1-phosphate uridylyltransferase